MDSLDTDTAAELVDMPCSERVRRLFNFEPLDYQAKVLGDEASRKLWICGRQVGETVSVVPADHALMNPGSDTLIAARYQETADELFRRTKHHIEQIGELKDIGVTSPNARTYEFDTGSRIMSRNAGPWREAAAWEGAQLYRDQGGCAGRPRRVRSSATATVRDPRRLRALSDHDAT